MISVHAFKRIIFSSLVGPITAILVLVAIGTHLPAYAQCPPGFDHHFEFPGCSTGGKRTFYWTDSHIDYTCRQKIEARLFMEQIRVYQNKGNYIRSRMDNLVNNVAAYLELIESVSSIYGALDRVRSLGGGESEDITIKAIRKLANEPVLGQEILQNAGIDASLAHEMTDFINDHKDAVIDGILALNDFKKLNLDITKFSLKGTLAPIIIEEGANAIIQTWGAIALGNLTEEMNGINVGWWYLEEYYRLGGTFDGNGDANRDVAWYFGLDPDATTEDIIEEVAERRLGRSGLFEWFTGPDFNKDVAVEFAESIKNFVRRRLPLHTDLEANVIPNRFLDLGLETQESFTIEAVISSPLSNGHHVCVKTRHGQVQQSTGQNKHVFVYQGPNRSIDPNNAFDSTEEIVFHISDGNEEMTKTLSFPLKNQTYDFFLKAHFEDPNIISYDLVRIFQDEIRWRVRPLGESQWSSWFPISSREPIKLNAGQFEFSFQEIDTIEVPANLTVILPDDQGQSKIAVYKTFANPPPTGSLQLTLQPNLPEAAWRVRGDTTWRSSGDIASGLSATRHDIEFRAVTDWQRPNYTNVSIQAGQQTVHQAAYRSLQVGRGGLGVDVLAGPDRIVNGQHYFWRIQGDTLWRQKGFIYENLPTGPTTIEFRHVYGWVKPDPLSLSIQANQTLRFGLSYFADPQATYRLGGRVRNNGSSVPGVTIHGFPPGVGPVVTDENGWFKAKVPDGFSGTLTAAKPGMSFEPAEGVPIQIQGKHKTNVLFRVRGTPSVTDKTQPTLRLLKPTDGETLSAGESYPLHWSATDDSGAIDRLVIEYRASNANFGWHSVTELSDEETRFAWTVPDLEGSTVRIRLRAYDGSGNQAQIISVPFRVNGGTCSRPETAPILKNPGSQTPHDYVTVDWLDVPGHSSYLLQVDTDPNFPHAEDHAVDASFKYLMDLTRNDYYFRVKAIGDCGESPWSKNRSIQVLANEAPEEPFSPDPAFQATAIPENWPNFAGMEPTRMAMRFALMFI